VSKDAIKADNFVCSMPMQVMSQWCLIFCLQRTQVETGKFAHDNACIPLRLAGIKLDLRHLRFCVHCNKATIWLNATDFGCVLYTSIISNKHITFLTWSLTDVNTKAYPFQPVELCGLYSCCWVAQRSATRFANTAAYWLYLRFWDSTSPLLKALAQGELREPQP